VQSIYEKHVGLKANANNKNLNVENLIIKHICVQKGPAIPHNGRHGGRLVKIAHVEVVLCEKEKKTEDKKEDRRKARVEKKSKKN